MGNIDAMQRAGSKGACSLHCIDIAEALLPRYLRSSLGGGVGDDLPQ
jgi:hypothetical protein